VTRLLLIVLIPRFAPVAARSASKEIVQLQRDLALLDDPVRMLQSSMEEKIGAVSALLPQKFDRVNEVHAAKAVLNSDLDEELVRQQRLVAATVRIAWHQI
jgi:hypothetical protein